NKVSIEQYANDLAQIKEVIRKEVITTARKALRLVINESDNKQILVRFIESYFEKIQPKYSSNLMSESDQKVANIEEILPEYAENAEDVDARVIIRDNFDAILSRYKNVM